MTFYFLHAPKKYSQIFGPTGPGAERFLAFASIIILNGIASGVVFAIDAAPGPTIAQGVGVVRTMIRPLDIAETGEIGDGDPSVATGKVRVPTGIIPIPFQIAHRYAVALHT
jgi:hypothetical protein